jgi:hypothetical protein
MTTAFDVMLGVARQAGPLIEGVATGGGTTSIADTALTSVPEATIDDTFNKGAAFLITDAGGVGAAPEGEIARVTDYVAATGTLTVATFTAAVAAGDLYGVTAIPHYLLLQTINNALRDLGGLPAIDTSLTTAAAQREYTIPAAAKKDLRQVWIQQSTTRPYDFEMDHYWRVVPNQSTYDLEFKYQPASGYTIRLVYCAPHAAIVSGATAIADAVPLEYAVWRSCYYVYRWRLHQEGRDDKKWTALMNEAAEYAEKYKPRVQLPTYTTKYWMTPEAPTDSVPITTADIPTA